LGSLGALGSFGCAVFSLGRFLPEAGEVRK
jgi:hypothetical protein